VSDAVYQVVRVYDERGELEAEFRTTLPVETNVSNSMQAGPQDVSGQLPIYINAMLAVCWNGLDPSGNPVRQGVYHVVIDLHGSNGDVVTLAQNVVMMSPAPNGPLNLVAAPNVVTVGDIVNITLFEDGQPVSAFETAQIYTLVGNLVTRVPLVQGRGSWNTSGVAPGLYLMAWQGTEHNGSQTQKVIKVILQR
jgi:hypothetical protein